MSLDRVAEGHWVRGLDGSTIYQRLPMSRLICRKIIFRLRKRQVVYWSIVDKL